MQAKYADVIGFEDALQYLAGLPDPAGTTAV